MRKLFYCDTVGAIGSFGLLILRVALGLIFFFHGGEKLKNKDWMEEYTKPIVAPPPPRVNQPAAEGKAADEKAAEPKAAEPKAAEVKAAVKLPFEIPEQWKPHLKKYLPYVEYAGGIALIVGFLTRIVSLALTLMMAGAIYMVHMANAAEPFVAATSSSYEKAVVYGAAALMFFIVGPGRLSLDAIFFGGSPTHPQPPYPTPPPQHRVP
jgi:uncharacterized membrane protein YphA (DoxX/SURF4 family)